MDDILLINKPKGITSFDVIRRLRKKLNIKKIGHAGTLDPMATGLMIVGVGKGTKKLTELVKLDKTYEAEILIGLSTDSADMEGKVLENVSVPELDEKDVITALKKIEGIHEYEVPRFSAIKVKGKKLYELSRKGTEFQPPKKQMQIYKATFLSLKKHENHYILRADFDVASGTYIRTLAVEIGKILNFPATLYSLNRRKVGEFELKDAKEI